MSADSAGPMVRENDIGRGIRVGDLATFTVEAFPGRTVQGRVDQIRQAPQRLRPGMTATVRIIPGGRGQAG